LEEKHKAEQLLLPGLSRANILPENNSSSFLLMKPQELNFYSWWGAAKLQRP